MFVYQEEGRCGTYSESWGGVNEVGPESFTLQRQADLLGPVDELQHMKYTLNTHKHFEFVCFMLFFLLFIDKNKGIRHDVLTVCSISSLSFSTSGLQPLMSCFVLWVTVTAIISVGGASGNMDRKSVTSHNQRTDTKKHIYEGLNQVGFEKVWQLKALLKVKQGHLCISLYTSCRWRIFVNEYVFVLSLGKCVTWCGGGCYK